MHWPIAVHDPPTGPADELFLQAPSTASSGRKLMTEILGGSYAFFGALISSSIHLPLIEEPGLHIHHNRHSKLRIGC
jgi:hypothetical protein